MLAVFFLCGGALAAKRKDKAKPKPKAPVGLQLKGINSVVISRYAKMSDVRDNPKSQRVAVIKNKATVAQLTELVNALPAMGSVQVKMADVEYIEAAFYGHYDSPPTMVKLFGGMVQAPDSSFYGGEALEEKEIHRILSQAKPVPKKGLRVAAAKSVSVEEYDHAYYEIKEYAPNRSAIITDSHTVTAMSELLNQMPLKGEIFASHAAGVPLIGVSFVEDNGEETLVNLYGRGISTTDGSFYAGGPGGELENKFLAIIDAELAKTAPELTYAFDAENAQTATLVLKKNNSDRNDAWEEVADLKLIKKIQAELSKLSPNGEIQKSWADDVEVLSATFSRPGAPKTGVEFYAGHLRMPDGTFYAPGDNPEKPLYELLMKQLK